MRSPLQQIFCLLVATLPLGAVEEWHTFTGKDGRTFVGRVISIDETHEKAIILTRKSGRNTELNFSILSEGDIAYLQEWKPGDTDTAEKEAEDTGRISPRLYPRAKDEIRSRINEIEKREGPVGIDRDQQKAVNRLNIYRYLSGVPDEVKADVKMMEQAKDAARACEKNDGLSHDLGHSTGLCNLANADNMLSSVRHYIEDQGANNRERRGHRKWCLNPAMGKTGFGEEGKYSAMVVLGSSTGVRMKDSWSYPGKGFFPKRYLHGNAWSLYLTKDAPDVKDIKVEVHKLTERPEKAFSSTEEIPGTALPVACTGVYENAINFEPQPETVKERGIYWVRITGGGLREGYVVELY